MARKRVVMVRVNGDGGDGGGGGRAKDARERL